MRSACAWKLGVQKDEGGEGGNEGEDGVVHGCGVGLFQRVVVKVVEETLQRQMRGCKSEEAVSP